MTWNYRVTRRKVYNGGEYAGLAFEIREVYYGDDGKLSWTEDPMEPMGETFMELADNLAIMGRAIGSDVLDIDVEGGAWLSPPFNRLHLLPDEQ